VLALLLRIQEVTGSDLAPQTGYAEVFRGIPQSLQESDSIMPGHKLRPLLSSSFPIHHSLTIPTFGAILKTSLNKTGTDKIRVGSGTPLE
jgi:hypothetical protein